MPHTIGVTDNPVNGGPIGPIHMRRVHVRWDNESPNGRADCYPTLLGGANLIGIDFTIDPSEASSTMVPSTAFGHHNA